MIAPSETLTTNQPILEVQVIDLTSTPHYFFQQLPPEWQTSLVTDWPQYSSSSRVLGLQIGLQIVGGGIIFTRPTPETEEYGPLTDRLFEAGWYYIGYLWVNPDWRGRQLASKWLDTVRNELPNQYFWLAIDDQALLAFYEKNGFHTLLAGENTIMTDHPLGLPYLL